MESREQKLKVRTLDSNDDKGSEGRKREKTSLRLIYVPKLPKELIDREGATGMAVAEASACRSTPDRVQPRRDHICEYINGTDFFGMDFRILLKMSFVSAEPPTLGENIINILSHRENKKSF